MKLFNGFRKALVPGKGFRKYLLYAFGEIVLVVIGILIALWLNNYKQEEDLRAMHQEVANTVLTQLNKDIADVEEYQKSLYALDQTFLRYFKKPHDTTATTQSQVVQLVFSINTLDMNDRVGILIDNANLSGSKYEQSLTSINGVYKNYLQDLEKIEDVIIDSVRENIAYVRDNTSWYTEFIVNLTCRNDCLDFIKNDDNYQGRIASLKFIYTNGYGGIVDAFYSELIQERDALIQQMEP